MDNEYSRELFGTTQQVVPPHRLIAGRLSCSFGEGGLRDIRWDDVEIVRAVSYLFRDRDWGTAPATVRDVTIESQHDAFAVRFELTINTPTGDIRARSRIEGTSDGALVFEVVATPDADIDTNRCGFVVLHPACAAGKELQVEHTDGTTDHVSFPREISPSQPVFDIRCLTYSAADGVVVQCRLEAELPADPAGKFEMEDQRNWSDASFKTYVASLLDPWPYVLKKDHAYTQTVHLAVASSRDRAPASSGQGDKATVEIGAPGEVHMPQIGVGVPPGLRNATNEENAALRELGAGWWVMEADFRDPAAIDDLTTATTLRTGLPVRLQLDAVVPDTLMPEDAAKAVADACTRAGLIVDAVRLLPAAYLKSYQPTDVWPDLPPLADYATAARKLFPSARIGGGMFTYFTELNRKRPPADGLDFIGHGTCPIVHAADDRSVMQTMETLSHIVRSVKALWPTLPYRLGPASIAMRRNPYGEAPSANRALERLAMADSDPRHRAQFGAAWTAAYAAAVAPLGIDVLSLQASHGASGPFPDGGATPIPCWPVLRQLSAATGKRIAPVKVSSAGISALVWENDDGSLEGIAVNVSDQPQRWQCLQPVSFENQPPVTEFALKPYATLRFIVAKG